MPNYGLGMQPQRRYNPYQIGGGQGFSAYGGGQQPQQQPQQQQWNWEENMPDWAKMGALGGFAGGQALGMLERRGQGLKYNVPTELPQYMVADWRKRNQMAGQGQLQGQLGDVRRNAARMGLGNSGFLQSMGNPAWQNYGQGQVQGEADIASAQMQAWMQLQRMMMEQDIQRSQMKQQGGGWGDILSGVARFAPMLFGMPPV